jgi:cell wall-associated NlpC family hydrolase
MHGSRAPAALAVAALVLASPADARNQPRPVRTATAPAAQRVVSWALRHVSWWRGKYSMTYRLPTGKSVAYMQSHEPPRTRRQGCDCSSFARWAMAQAGVDIGTYTGNIWTARSALPFRHSSGQASTVSGLVLRGYHRRPPGGYKVGDLLFYGVTGLDRGIGHVAIYMGGGRLVQCSGRRGSNAGLRLDYAGAPSGYVRYTSVTG